MKGGGMKTAVLVITVPLLAKEGLGEVDYDPALQLTQRTGETERAAEQRK